MNEIEARLTLVARWRYRTSLFITCVIVAVAALFLVTLGYIVVIGLLDLPYILRSYGAYKRGEMGLLEATFYGLGLELMIGMPIAIYAALYVLPFLLTLPASAAIVALWQSPPRALLLRPFNRGQLSHPLKRIVRRNIALYAHVYTLSDADVNVPAYVRIPLLFGQLALFSFRMSIAFVHQSRTTRSTVSLARGGCAE